MHLSSLMGSVSGGGCGAGGSGWLMIELVVQPEKLQPAREKGRDHQMVVQVLGTCCALDGTLVRALSIDNLEFFGTYSFVLPQPFQQSSDGYCMGFSDVHHKFTQFFTQRVSVVSQPAHFGKVQLIHMLPTCRSPLAVYFQGP